MKIVRYGLAIGLLAGLGACSDMGGGSSAGSHSAAMTQPTVAPGTVKQVQSKLHDDGYYKQGAIDGVWGTGTESAVRAFQHDHNLTSNGQLDVPTLQALNIVGGSDATNNNMNQNAGTNTSDGMGSNDGNHPTQPMNATPDTSPNTPPAAPAH